LCALKKKFENSNQIQILSNSYLKLEKD
jgi:hypothetical protein